MHGRCHHKKVTTPIIFDDIVYFYFMSARGTEASHIIEILKKEIVYLTGNVIVFMKHCNFSKGSVMHSYWLINAQIHNGSWLLH